MDVVCKSTFPLTLSVHPHSIIHLLQTFGNTTFDVCYVASCPRHGPLRHGEWGVNYTADYSVAFGADKSLSCVCPRGQPLVNIDSTGWDANNAIVVVAVVLV